MDFYSDVLWSNSDSGVQGSPLTKTNHSSPKELGNPKS